MYFVSKGRKKIQNYFDKTIMFFNLWLLQGLATNASKNTNTLLMSEWYIGMFQIYT
jgi:hypothetical protein